jgi:hypothetical protein
MDNLEGKFIFDTGANAILLNSSGSTNGVKNEFQSLTGSFSAEEVKVERFAVGDFVITNFKAFTIDLSDFEKHLGCKILGIIGAQMFDSEILRFDNYAKTIEIYPREYLKRVEQNAQVKCPINFENDVPIIELNIGNKKFRFGLDSGSSISLISDIIVAGNAKLFNKTSRTFDLMTANATKAANESFLANALSIEGRTLDNIELASFDFEEINKQFDNDLAGILSMDALPFEEVVIDFKKGKIYFN